MNWRVVVSAGALFTAAGSQAAWSIEQSDVQCSAVWYMAEGYELRLFENYYTRKHRAENHPDLKTWGDPAILGRRPVLMLYADGPRWPSSSSAGFQETPMIDVRLFPDDDQPADLRGVVTTEVVHSPERRNYVLWPDFDRHERFARWGTAKETKDSEGIRVPEARFVLRWTPTLPQRIRAFGDWFFGGVRWVDAERATRYLEFSLWRTSNMLNKTRHCSENVQSEHDPSATGDD